MLTTGLVAGSSARRRVRRASVLAVSVALVGTALATTAVVAQQDDAAAGTSPEALIDRLIDLEEELPGLPPEQVLISEDATWAEFLGDFVGAEVAFDTVSDELRALFIDADEADGPVAVAVSDVARAYLLLANAYEQLAIWETADLAFPVGTVDELGVATGADELYGIAEAGFRMVLDAHSRLLAGYAVLRDVEAADDTERQFFEVQYLEEQAFDSDLRPDIHRALSLETTEQLVPVDAFTTDAPGLEGRARIRRYVCIDTEAYLAADPGIVEVPEELAAIVDIPVDDCPALPPENEVRLVQP